MKKTIAVMMLLAGGLFAAPRFSVGIGIGVPAPVAVVRPACPGPGYTWVDGYYAPNRVWVAGYWAAPVVHVAPIVRPVVRIAPREVVVAPRFGYARPFAPRYEHFRR